MGELQGLGLQRIKYLPDLCGLAQSCVIQINDGLSAFLILLLTRTRNMIIFEMMIDNLQCSIEKQQTTIN